MKYWKGIYRRMNKTEKTRSERILSVVFILYLLFLIKMIVFKYPFAQMQQIVDTWQKDVVLEGLHTANFIPLKTIKMYIRYYDMPGIRSFSNLFGNILIFVPVGILLPLVHRASQKIGVSLLNALLLIIGIEVFQLFSNFGAFDVDDIILNGLGVLIGSCVYRLGISKKARKGDKKFQNF